jgi:hypothetical protein
MSFVSRLSAAQEEVKSDCKTVSVNRTPTYEEVHRSIEKFYHDEGAGHYMCRNLSYFGENMRFFVATGPQDTEEALAQAIQTRNSWNADLLQLTLSFQADLPSDGRLRFRALHTLNSHDMKLLCTTLVSWFAAGKYTFRDHFSVMK